MQQAEPETQAAAVSHDEVVKASLGSYASVGQQARPFWDIPEGENGSPRPDLLLPDLGRIEEIETEDSFDNFFEVRRITQLRSWGMEVWVVVPRSRLQEAHERLQGLADRLQPWWVDDEQIMFGHPRVP